MLQENEDAKETPPNTPSRKINLRTPDTGRLVMTTFKSNNVLMGSGGFSKTSNAEIPISFLTTRRAMPGHNFVVDIARESAYKVKEAILLPSEILKSVAQIFGEVSSSASVIEPSVSTEFKAFSSMSSLDQLISEKKLGFISALKPALGERLRGILSNFIEENEVFCNADPLIKSLKDSSKGKVGEVNLQEVLEKRILWSCTNFIWDLDSVLDEIKTLKLPKSSEKSPAKNKTLFAEIKSLKSEISKTNASSLGDVDHLNDLINELKKNFEGTQLKKDFEQALKNEPSPEQYNLIAKCRTELLDGLKVMGATAYVKPASSITISAENETYISFLQTTLKTESHSKSRITQNIPENPDDGSDRKDEATTSPVSEREYFAYRVYWKDFGEGENHIRIPEVHFMVRSGGTRPNTELEDEHQGDHVTAYAACLQNFINSILPLEKYDNLLDKVNTLLQSCFEDTEDGFESLTDGIIVDDGRREFRETIENIEDRTVLDRLIKSYQIDHACSQVCQIASKFLEKLNKDRGGSIPNKLEIGGINVVASTGGNNEGDSLLALEKLSKHISLNKLSQELEEKINNTSSSDKSQLRYRLQHCESEKNALGAFKTSEDGSIDSFGIINDALVTCFDFDVNFALLLKEYDKLRCNDGVGMLFLGAIKRHFNIMGVALVSILKEDDTNTTEKNCKRVCNNFIQSLLEKNEAPYTRTMKAKPQNEGIQDLNAKLSSFSDDRKLIFNNILKDAPIYEISLSDELASILEQKIEIADLSRNSPSKSLFYGDKDDNPPNASLKSPKKKQLVNSSIFNFP